VADNVTVSNAPTSVNTDIPVRTLDKAGEQVQVVAIDYGGAGAESLTVPDFATETTLQTIAVKGQATMANSLPVVIASNQTAITISEQFSEGQAPTFATVGIISASVGISAGTYHKLCFCNTSVNTISLGFDNPAVSNRGIVLRTGEKIIIDGPIKCTTVNAVATASSSNLAIQAFV